MRTMPILSVATLTLLAVAAGGCEHTTTTVETPPLGKPGEAASDFDTRPTPPVAARTHYAAGQLAESRGDVDAAAGQYQAALKLMPTDAPSLYHLGMILTAERKPDAIGVWQQYVAVTGGTAVAYSDLGFALDLAGRPAESEDAFRAGIAKDPKCEACRVNYGRMLARRGRMDAAETQLAAVLTPAEVQFDLGSVLEQQGHKDAAVERYRRALVLDPQLSDATIRLAAVQ